MRKMMSRRDLIKGSVALGLCAAATASRAAGPEPVSITPALVEAARKEAKVVLYSAMDLPVGEKLAKAFEARYPGIEVEVERAGSERLFQRVAQEFASGIHAGDVVNSADAAHFIPWKKNGWLMPFVSEDMANHFLPGYRDSDGMFATTRVWLSSIAYNTNLVKPGCAKVSRICSSRNGQRMVKATRPTAAIAHHHIPAGSRTGVGIFEASPSACCRCTSTDPPKLARRTGRDGRRQRANITAARGRASRPVYPARYAPSAARPDICVGASERGAVFQAGCTHGSSSSSSISRRNIQSTPRCIEAGAQKLSDIG